jgi:hypothetical protein
LKLEKLVAGTTGIFEALSSKIGVVLLVLGLMHFLNMAIFAKLRERGEKPLLGVNPPPIPVG